jgi:prepilin-type N-terminal cleavage/methylation domain-containing protein
MPITLSSSERGSRWHERGLTLIELLISVFLASLIATAAFHYYKAQHEVYLSQASIADRQGNLRSALGELARQIRRAGYLVPGGGFARLSPRFDTLEVYVGQGGGASVDTLRYFVNDAAKALVRQVNQTEPQTFAEGVDSASFVPVGGTPVREIAIALVSTVGKQFEGSALATPRRLGTRVQLRNR